jgi:hypothetical protein
MESTAFLPPEVPKPTLTENERTHLIQAIMDALKPLAARHATGEGVLFEMAVKEFGAGDSVFIAQPQLEALSEFSELTGLSLDRMVHDSLGDYIEWIDAYKETLLKSTAQS